MIPVISRFASAFRTLTLNFKGGIEQSVKVIDSPIDVNVEGRQLQFSNGKELAEAEFDKYYLISRISAKANRIVIDLEENKRVNDTSWAGEKEVSFF